VLRRISNSSIHAGVPNKDDAVNGLVDTVNNDAKNQEIKDTLDAMNTKTIDRTYSVKLGNATRTDYVQQQVECERDEMWIELMLLILRREITMQNHWQSWLTELLLI